MPKYHHRSTIQTTPFFSRQSAMPSARRIKVFGVLVFIFVISILFWTANLRQTREPDVRTAGDFYAKTKSALDNQDGGTGTGTKAVFDDGDEEIARAMSMRLKEAAQVAKDKANSKAPKPDPPSQLVGVGSAAEGAREDKKGAGEEKVIKGETQEEHEVEMELNRILKKSPMIIFSKSYCPYSRKAKGILLEKYNIEPEPFVVELDQHPLGAQLQASLNVLTKRGTVPNILINGVSIGGGDDVADMDSKKTLIAKIQELGGTKMTKVQMRSTEESHGEAHGLR